jgi:hypothetical protein
MVSRSILDATAEYTSRPRHLARGRLHLVQIKHERWIRSDVGNRDLVFEEDSAFQMGRSRLQMARPFDRSGRKHPMLYATRVFD